VLACVGCLYVYLVIVVLPTVRSGLVKAPKLAADCTLQQRIAAWCSVVATALFNSAQLSADKHKNAPGEAFLRTGCIARCRLLILFMFILCPALMQVS
jgi:hypothetical protein